MLDLRAPNRLREKLAAGVCVTGTAIYSYSPNMVEAAGYSGIDFVRIDSEHAWRRDDSMDHMVRAAIIAGVVPIVRIDRDDPYLARKAFEIGAGGIVVPNVTTAEDARAIVLDARFPPLGRRGLGGLCLAGEWGRRDTAEWVDHSNRQLLVGVMIESIEAMPNIDAIMAVEGVDFALFGPGDFGMSLVGRPPAEIAAETRKALAATARAARSAGKHTMYGVGLSDISAQESLDLGVTMLEFSHDVVMIRSVLEAKVKTFGSAAIARP
ncbi:MAG: 2-keto-3-deoxy-L-rhamnonate aldolase [Devosia sp.]|nr:2-keto-3-deoxy-L-rhamnonate aldolase [Devosia sp.]